MRKRHCIAVALFMAVPMLGGAAFGQGSSAAGRNAAARADAPQSPGVNQAEVLATVNAYRRSFGLPPVRLDRSLTRAAYAQSAAMAQQGVMSHEAGGDFRARLLSNGVGRAAAVENIAWNQRSFADVMRTWQGSSGHSQNMQTPDMTRLGVAMVNSSNGPYWTLVLAGEARRR